MRKNHIITGGAGFIGTNLSQLLSEKGDNVFVFDDMSLGSMKNIKFLPPSAIFCCDLTKIDDTLAAFKSVCEGSDRSNFIVWHFAANSDIQAGVEDITVDFNKTFLTTFNVLKAMRIFGLDEIAFASTSAVYGDHGNELITELSEQLPVSNYGAMKKASEAILHAATVSFIKKLHVFRFPNVVGAPATHGVIYDFINKLYHDPNVLKILGDGTQKKAYLHVSDLLDAMLHIISLNDDNGVNIFNIGPVDDGMFVSEIAKAVANAMNLQPDFLYGSENRGWVGDVPKFAYSIRKLEETGWRCDNGSKHAVVRAIYDILGERK